MPFLGECLDSIWDQTIDEWELLAVDDHSDDQSLEMLRQYAARDARIRVFKNVDHGIIPALQLAYSKSTGDYITRMDADDIMIPQKLEELKKILTKIGAGSLAIACVEYFSETTLGDGYKKYAQWLNQLTRNSNNFSDIYKECVIPSPCWMVRREDFDRCGGFNSEMYPEDYDLCFRFYKKGLKVRGTNEVLHRWRDYTHRTSRTHEHYADNRFLELKLKYFLELDYKQEKNLVLWGAGAKGKLIAQNLNSHAIQFTWISNNEKKIGHTIHGQIIHEPDKINRLTSADIIISVANPEEQEELIMHLSEHYNKYILYNFC